MLDAIDGSLTEAERKRLDKAVTIIKVGIKILKKVMRNREKTAAAEKAAA